jgi:predicted small integral membrane protein
VAIAIMFTLAVFGNLTDYRTNFAFVQHVLNMDTIFPDSTIHYRAITSPALHHAAYWLIIGVETLTTVLCWWGAGRMLRELNAPAPAFRAAKTTAVAGLTVGYLLWQIGIFALGNEWFGMWMSEHWNGVESVFRYIIMTLGALIYVSLPEDAPAGGA